MTLRELIQSVDSEQYRFYDVEAFQEIQEPVIDSEDKTITSHVRDVGMLYTDTYKWKNGKLTKIASKKDSLY